MKLHFTTYIPYRSFVAEMRFFVRQLNRDVHGRETASNKQMASKACALSLVRQLFHLGVLEAFTGTRVFLIAVDYASQLCVT